MKLLRRCTPPRSLDVAQGDPRPSEASAHEGGEDGLAFGAVRERDRLVGGRIDQFVDREIVTDPVHALILRMRAGDTQSGTGVEQPATVRGFDALPNLGNTGAGLAAMR